MNKVQSAFEESFSKLLKTSEISFLYHENGFRIASYDDKKALIPASNTKLFHSAAALLLENQKDVLPSLQVYATGRIASGVLHGDLLLDCCGSLFFTGRYPVGLSLVEKQNKLSRRADTFAEKLKEAGIRQVTGTLKLSFKRWNGLEDNPLYNAATPFLFNENTVDTFVEHRQIQTCPKNPLLFSFEKDKAVKTQDKRAGNAVFYNPDVDSKDYWRVNKTDVNDYARRMLVRNLETRGIVFANQASAIKSQFLFELKDEESLADYIYPINQFSDNLRAELLALQINRCIRGAANYDDLQNSLNLILKDKIKGKFELYDGSGLSRKNKASTAAIVSLLEYMSQSEAHHKFEQSLSVAATSGTLAKRFQRTSFERRFIGKTGTLSKVTALSGYWFKDPYTKVTLSFLGNGGENADYWQALESFAKKLK